MKDEFLATVSHELRTPLNAILGWAQLLRGGRAADAERGATALETIERNARAQAQLIEDLLDVSRIITGKLRLDVARRRPRGAIVRRGARDACAPPPTPRASRSRWSSTPARPVIGDPTRLQQVVWNLLSNAVKFTPEGGHVDVRLDAAASRTSVIDGASTRAGDRAASSCRTCSIASGRPTARRRGSTAGSGSASRSCAPRRAPRRHGPRRERRRRAGARPSPSRLPRAMRDAAPVPSAATLGAPRPADGGSGSRSRCRRRGSTGCACSSSTTSRTRASSSPRCSSDSGRGGASRAARRAEALGAARRERPDVLVSDIGMPGEDGYSLMRKVAAGSAAARPRAVGVHRRPGSRARAVGGLHDPPAEAARRAGADRVRRSPRATLAIPGAVHGYWAWRCARTGARRPDGGARAP